MLNLGMVTYYIGNKALSSGTQHYITRQRTLYTYPTYLVVPGNKEAGVTFNGTKYILSESLQHLLHFIDSLILILLTADHNMVKNFIL